MKNLIKIKEDFISEVIDKDFPIHKLADELMKRAYNQALEDAATNVSMKLNTGRSPYIDRESILNLKIK